MKTSSEFDFDGGRERASPRRTSLPIHYFCGPSIAWRTHPPAERSERTEQASSTQPFFLLGDFLPGFAAPHSSAAFLIERA
jgi:hypothetical protein